MLVTLSMIDLKRFESELQGSVGYYIITNVTLKKYIYINNGNPFYY